MPIFTQGGAQGSMYEVLQMKYSRQCNLCPLQSAELCSWATLLPTSACKPPPHTCQVTLASLVFSLFCAFFYFI